MKTQTATGGKDYPLLNFEQFERLIWGFFSEYNSRQFTTNDGLFSCALFNASEVGTCPDSIVTYSAITGKWYLHILSGEFKASEGDSLTEAMTTEMLKGLGISFPSKERDIRPAGRDSQAHTFEQFEFLLDFVLSFNKDKDHCEFVNKQQLFSCAVSPTYPYSGTPREAIVTYSTSTQKWYLHTFFDGFKAFEGDNLGEM